MEQVDDTVARHITRTSPPNEWESTALVILSIDRAKMLRFASSKTSHSGSNFGSNIESTLANLLMWQ